MDSLRYGQQIPSIQRKLNKLTPSHEKQQVLSMWPSCAAVTDAAVTFKTKNYSDGHRLYYTCRVICSVSEQKNPCCLKEELSFFPIPVLARFSQSFAL